MCRTVVNYFSGISSRHTCIFIPICTSSYSSIRPCVFYSGLPRRRLNQSQTGPLFILGDCNCFQPPGKCSPAVRDHNRLHMHLHTPSILPSSSSKVNQLRADLQKTTVPIWGRPPQVYYSQSYPQLSFTCGKCNQRDLFPLLLRGSIISRHSHGRRNKRFMALA